MLVQSFLQNPRELWLMAAHAPYDSKLLVKGASPGQAEVSPDGKWLSYTRPTGDGLRIFVQPLTGKGEAKEVSVVGGRSPVWRGDSRELYFERPGELRAVSITTVGDSLVASAPRTLFNIRTQGGATNNPHNIAVSASGERFLINSIIGDTDNVPLEVTLDWTAGLKK